MARNRSWDVHIRFFFVVVAKSTLKLCTWGGIAGNCEVKSLGSYLFSLCFSLKVSASGLVWNGWMLILLSLISLLRYRSLLRFSMISRVALSSWSFFWCNWNKLVERNTVWKVSWPALATSQMAPNKPEEECTIPFFREVLNWEYCSRQSSCCL